MCSKGATLNLGFVESWDCGGGQGTQPLTTSSVSWEKKPWWTVLGCRLSTCPVLSHLILCRDFTKMKKPSSS